jgi:hypothetical protein
MDVPQRMVPTVFITTFARKSMDFMANAYTLNDHFPDRDARVRTRTEAGGGWTNDYLSEITAS